MILRSDFRTVTIMNRLHRKCGEERSEPIPFHQYQRWHSSFLFFQYTMVAMEWKLVELIIFKFVVVRSFTADSNLLQPTEGVNSTPSHVTFFSCLSALMTMSHTTLAQVFVRVISSMSLAPVWLISLRPSLRTLHLSLPSSTSSFWSFTSSCMWIGSEQNPVCASANEESGLLVNNDLTGWDICIAYDEIAREDHSYVATRCERSWNVNSWRLVLNSESASGPVDQWGLWPTSANPIWAKPFLCCCVLCVVVGCWLLVVGCWLLVVGCWLLGVGFGHSGSNLRRTAQNFVFFSLSRHHVRSFCPSLGVFTWNFGGVWSAGTLKCARLESESPNRHILGSRHSKKKKNTTKIPREDTQRETKRAKMGAGEWKKSAEFWAPHPLGPHPSGGLHLRGPTLWGPTMWPKLDWPKLVKSGWTKRDWPKSVSSWARWQQRSEEDL